MGSERPTRPSQDPLLRRALLGMAIITIVMLLLIALWLLAFVATG